jgi:hypothetical protein
MKFNFQFYAKLPNGKVEPVSQKPLTLDFPSVDKAREVILARSLAEHERAPDRFRSSQTTALSLSVGTRSTEPGPRAIRTRRNNNAAPTTQGGAPSGWLIISCSRKRSI